MASPSLNNNSPITSSLIASRIPNAAPLVSSADAVSNGLPHCMVLDASNDDSAGIAIPVVRNYFVDEAGDPVLWDRRGNSLVGTEGCSRCFMLGAAWVPDPDEVGRQLNALRAELLADRYFAGVPSFDPARRKTALVFHAKDDLPEVRREVFRLLLRSNVRVQVLVRRKEQLMLDIKRKNQKKVGYRYSENDIYDDCISRLFRNIQHQADENHITFAKRGTSSRVAALAKALEKARNRFEKKWGKPIDSRSLVIAANPSEVAGLQIVDYYLWTVQRLFERGEDRFFNMMHESIEMVLDVDDRRKTYYGVFYNKKNRLTLDKITIPTAQKEEQGGDLGKGDEEKAP